MNARKYLDKLNGKVNIVGINIKNIREKLGISRQALSDKLMILGVDISSQSIFDIETLPTEAPYIATTNSYRLWTMCYSQNIKYYFRWLNERF